MVCLGNICRSPLAEAIVREHFAKNGIHARIDSCGTSGWHEGEKPDTRAIHVAHDRGIDLSTLRSRPFRHQDFDAFDVIFAMDRSNYNDLLEMAKTPEHREKIHLFLHFAGRDFGDDVPDPYYGNLADFYRVYDLLDRAANLIVLGFQREAPTGE